jgi:tetratricopeptide (TPR) repeat protein/TolB-like protein
MKTVLRLLVSSAVVIGMAGWPSAVQAQVASGAVVLVLPFENPKADPQLEWLREGVALLIADVLDADDIQVVPRDERVLAFDQLQLPVAAQLSRASTIKVGQAVEATTVIVGRVELVDDQLTVAARPVQLDAGRLRPEVVVRAPLPELFTTVARVTAALTGQGAPPAGWQAPPTPAAFELYTKGLIAESASARRTHLEQALKLAPNYDGARLALWELHSEQGEHQRAFDAVSPIKTGSRMEREARFAGAMSLLRLKRDDQAYSVLRTMQTDAPLAAVANAVGVIQLRRGATAQTGRATYYFNQATELDPAEGDYFFNLGYAYWLENDAKGAVYWLREAVRRDPADGDAHYVLSVALQQTGARTEASRERELATRLSSKYAAWEARAAGGGELVPKGLERLHERLDRAAARMDMVVTSAGQRDQKALAAFHLDAARRAFDRELDREATQELRRALYLSPYLAEAHVLLGRILLRGGRAEEAVQALKIAIWSEESAAAHVAMGEAYLALADVASARAAADRALVLDPRSAAGAALKARIPPAR